MKDFIDHEKLLQHIIKLLSRYDCRYVITPPHNIKNLNHNDWEQQKQRNTPDILVNGKRNFYIELKYGKTLEPIQWFLNYIGTYELPVVYTGYDKAFVVSSPDVPKELTNNIVIYYHDNIYCEKEIRNIKPDVKFEWAPKNGCSKDDMYIRPTWDNLPNITEILDWFLL